MGVNTPLFNKAYFVQNFLLLFTIIFFTSAQSFAFQGKVVDTDGNPIVGATVATNLTTVGTITDKNGFFELPDNNDITYITVSSVGFKAVNYPVLEIPQVIKLEMVYYQAGDILVTADRAEIGITPIAFENISSDDIERDYSVGEFPLLLQSTPNLHSFADGGGSLGYSYVRIRGFDDKRIVTYINGVPLNDPEDHATYFVDIPDFPANVTDIQVQRGVGNSLYGDASFGGTINIVTSAFNAERKTTLSTGYGGYKDAGDIYKQSLSFSSGLVDGKWSYNGRFSKQKSGGYKDNSWYNGWAYYFSIGKISPKMTTEFFVYGGPIQMHLAYYGEPRSDLKNNRKFNRLNYSNETDNFNQPHYHLHNVYKINEQTTFSNTFYYIRGKGYYEQLKTDSWSKPVVYSDYNLQEFVDSTVTTGDVVRQQWVEKSQYGWNPRLDIKHNKGQHSIGGSFYTFDSNHWGQVVWAKHLNSSLDPQHTYYRYFGKKKVATFFVQEYYTISEKLSTQVTAQFRYQKYSMDSKKMGAFAGEQYDLTWNFFSPRIGFTYKVDEKLSLFTNFSVASRTPSDGAIYDANDPSKKPAIDTNGEPLLKSERVYDLELGMNYLTDKYQVGINLFNMSFNNEIVDYGGINESGIQYKTNIDKSVHAGVELTGAVKINDNLNISGNFSYNLNEIKEYSDIVQVWSNDWSTSRDSSFDISGNTIPAFPKTLTNFIVDYKVNNFRLTLNTKFLGEQFVEIYNIDSLKIDPSSVSSISASYAIKNVLGKNNLIFKFRIDNMFDKLYEISGYGWMYGYDNSSNEAEMIREGEYYVAPERSIFGQIVMELF